MMGKSAVDIVSNGLDNCRYLLVPESAIGCVSPCHNGEGDLRPDAVELTISDISRLIYLDEMKVIGEVANGK